MQKIATTSRSRRKERLALRRKTLEAIDIAKKAGQIFGYAEFGLVMNGLKSAL